MRRFLLFRLTGPMSAFGEITVGERRSLWNAPSKSGILGFLAACIGVPRAETDAHRDLDRALGFAVRLQGTSTLSRDFQTVQNPKEADRKRRRRRGDDLSTRGGDLQTDRDNLSTVLSERDYHIEPDFTVGLWSKADGYDLDCFLPYLSNPVFPPYLGRKCCVLGEPVAPNILCADSLLSAFWAYDHWKKESDGIVRASQTFPYRRRIQARPQIWFEIGAGLDKDEAHVVERRVRRDAVRDRSQWHFSDREEGRLSWPSDGEAMFEETLT